MLSQGPFSALPGDQGTECQTFYRESRSSATEFRASSLMSFSKCTFCYQNNVVQDCIDAPPETRPRLYSEMHWIPQILLNSILEHQFWGFECVLLAFWEDMAHSSVCVSSTCLYLSISILALSSLFYDLAAAVESGLDLSGSTPSLGSK